jgi:hypothetical protein
LGEARTKDVSLALLKRSANPLTKDGRGFSLLRAAG